MTYALILKYGERWKIPTVVGPIEDLDDLLAQKGILEDMDPEVQVEPVALTILTTAMCNVDVETMSP